MASPLEQRPSSTQVLEEIERRYNSGRVESSEYAALRDHANYFDVLRDAKKSYVKNKFARIEPAQLERVIDTISMTDKRNDAGLYGKNGEKYYEVGLHLTKLREAYIAERAETSHDEILEKVTRPLHRIIYRLENPTSQSSQDIPTKAPPRK